MSKAPTQTGTNTTTTSNAPPQYVQDAQRYLLGTGAALTAPFLTGMPNYAIAGFNPDQEMGFDLARYQAQQAYSTPPVNLLDYGSYFANTASANPSMIDLDVRNALPPAGQTTAAQTTAALAPSQAASATAAQAEASAAQAALSNGSQLDYADIQKFFNPYQRDVGNTTMQQLEEANARQLAAIRARQGAEGAYGGNRGALQATEQNRNFGNTLASTLANLYQSGWNNSAQLGAGNAQLRQQTGLANQTAQNQVALANAAAQNQAALANAAGQNAVGMFNAGAQNQLGMFNAGQQNQVGMYNTGQANQVGMYNTGQQNQFNLTTAQMEMQQAMQNAANQQQASLANAGFAQQSNLFNAAAPLNAAQTQNALNQTSWQQQMQSLQALLGTGGQQQQLAQQAINVPFTAMSNLAGIVPSQYGTSGTSSQPIYGPSLTQTLGAIAPLGVAALGAFSDETMKKDKEKLGKDPRTDLDIYKYRWKGERPDAPKTTGPMAQQVEKKFPGSTTRVGGKLAIKGSARQLLGI